MTDQIITELEAAAGIIMAPPNIVSNEQRQSAESVFMNFRKSKNPYTLCREILEISRNHFVLFECAEVLKSAIIREWSFLLASDRTSLRQYLMQYVINQELPPFVRDKLLQVIAIMVKRASVDDDGQERSVILQEVENLIVNAETNKKILGCTIILNLMQEYGNTVKSSDVGLSWELHFKVKKQFEAVDLKRIFSFCVYLFYEVTKVDPPYSDTLIQLTLYLLRIAEGVLTWGSISPVLPKRIIGLYESVYQSDQAPALKLNASWSDIMLNPQFIALMFKIFYKIRGLEQLAHHCLSCLVQLASLTGTIVKSQKQRSDYLELYLTTLFSFLSEVTVKRTEAIGISNIVKKLSIFYIHEFSKLPDNMQNTMLDEFTRLTCNFCDGATIEEADNEDDKLYGDAFETMLEAWMSIIPEYLGNYGDTLHDGSIKIFNKYLQCHLAPPDGSRRRCDDVVEIEDNEDNDRVKYKDQLQAIGMFGRVVPDHALPMLIKLIESRLEKLISHFFMFQSRAMNISEATFLDDLFEDIHWITLVAGHVLCMDSDGETPMIPSEIMQYSINQCKNNESNLQATIAAIFAIESKAAVPEGFNQCDHVIRIFYNILKLCAVEDLAVVMRLGHFLSPEVGSTSMWFIKRLCLSYLLPVENYYQEISPTLIGSLGKDTDCSKLIISFVLTKVQSNIMHFQSEPILLRDTVDLFCDIVCVKQKSTYIIKTESMRKLITFFEQLEPGTLPQNVLRGLCKGFVLAGAALCNPQDINSYLEMILTPIQSRFQNLLRQDIEKFSENELLQKIVIDTLECFIGIAKGSLMATVQVLFHFLAPMLGELPMLLRMFRDCQIIVQLVLELFGQCGKYILCYLPPLSTKTLYECTLSTVQMYAKCNANRLSNESFAEESSLQDISLILDLLTFILSKDCLDFSAPASPEEVTIAAADVSLFGLNFIMPLMTMELLKYPNLCAQYYRLLVLINDIYPEKICGLPETMQQMLLRSIELGFTNFGNDIVQACIDFVQGMANYIFKYNSLNSQFAQNLKPLFKLVLDLTLGHQISSELLGSAGTCIYSLICCYPEEYQMLVQTLIQGQTDPLVGERLAAAFNNLTLNVPMNCERHPKLKFRDNFDKFIANVHGFLLTK